MIIFHVCVHYEYLRIAYKTYS